MSVPGRSTANRHNAKAQVAWSIPPVSCRVSRPRCRAVLLDERGLPGDGGHGVRSDLVLAAVGVHHQDLAGKPWPADLPPVLVLLPRIVLDQPLHGAREEQVKRAGGDPFVETTTFAHQAWVLYQRRSHAEAVTEQHTVLAFRQGNGLPQPCHRPARRGGDGTNRRPRAGRQAHTWPRRWPCPPRGKCTWTRRRRRTWRASSRLGAAGPGRPPSRSPRPGGRARCSNSYERARSLDSARWQFTARRAMRKAVGVAADAGRGVPLLTSPSGHGRPSAAGTPA